jgi:hypothetical protein
LAAAAGLVVIVSVDLPALPQGDLRDVMSQPGAPPANAIWLDSLDLAKMVSGGRCLAPARRWRADGAGAPPVPRRHRPAPLRLRHKSPSAA